MDNAFEELTERGKHAQEIAQTRVGYLGGSDAKMVYKVATSGAGALSATEIKRLNVCCGNSKNVSTFGGNAATERGHDFEDYMVSVFAAMDVKVEREKFMQGQKYNHFTAMAHADYYAGGTVYECKCVVGKTTEAVANSYYAQLQWYYMLGAEMVYLVHGIDANQVADIVEIPRNEGFVAMLERGCELIDAYCDSIVALDQLASVAYTDAPQDMRDMIKSITAMQDTIKSYTAQLEVLKNSLCSAMVSGGIGEIRGDVSVHYTPERTVRTIDTKKLLAVFPDVATADVYTEGQRKGYITITAKRNGQVN